MVLPPIKNANALRIELSRCPARFREDAIQEAWAAHLSGDDPVAAAGRFRKNEVNASKRRADIRTGTAGEFAVETSGKRTDLTNGEPLHERKRHMPGYWEEGTKDDQ